MNIKHPNLYFIIFLGIAFSVALLLSWQWSATTWAQESALIEVNQTPRLEKKEKPLKQTVKGIYLTAYSAGNPKKMAEILDLLDKTELNAVVIDIKDYSGLVLYDSQVPLVKELNTKNVRIADMRALVSLLHEHNVYAIARQTVFQDPILAEKKSEWAFKSKAGGSRGEAGLWRDRKGLAWVNPAVEDVWKYNVDIAKEAVKLGFDEINFDYVRFPSDGNMSTVVYTNNGRAQTEVMRDFYHFLSEELKNEPTYISLDMFGFVMERHDGMNIGQRLEDAVDETDYICPMMYPSHYPAGHLGLNNPAEYPALIFENGMKKGQPYFEGKRAQVRPWIQAFNIGAVYGAEKIRAQIDVIERYTDAGWLLWNASNRYSSAGLKNE